MAAFSRDGALKNAEKALRLGRIDAAIAEYVRVVEAQPRDWNSANALGDLHVRANQIDKAVAQYVRIADHLAGEGFYPKAAALYKKVLKVKPGDEHAQLQSGDIAARQGLLADAKAAYKAIAEGRRLRGDRAGAAAIVIKLGALDPKDLDARLDAARAASESGDVALAIRELRAVGLELGRLEKITESLGVFQQAFDLDPTDSDTRGRLLDGYLQTGQIGRARRVADGTAELKKVAAALDAAGQGSEALEVLADIAARDPGDLQVRARLAKVFVAKGDLDRARTYLNPETAGDSAPLWLTLAEIELTSGQHEKGKEAVSHALRLDAAQREAATQLGCRLTQRFAEAGYACLDAVADHAVADNDFAAAAAALHDFVTRVEHHVVALMRLVEVCVDGGLETTMYDAQARLADAYLEVGRGLEARIISEDLVAREPYNAINIERFRRALIMLGEANPEAIIEDRLNGESPFLITENMDLNEGVFFEDEPAAAVPEAAATEERTEPYALALTYRELGMVDDAMQALELAAQSPERCFDAAALLGQLHLEREDRTQAIVWFERAAAATPPTADAGRALLYDLGETLEKAGEHERARAVFAGLEAESAGYRDAARRVKRLAKAALKG